MRIAYLPFYVSYYEGLCSDFPREKLAAARHCADALSRHGEVVWNGDLIVNAEQADKIGRGLRVQEADCVVVFTSIAVFGGITWAALRHLSIPVLIWNAQAIREVGRRYTMVDIVRNTGQIGTQALANTLLRQGRWFRVVTGYENSRRTSEALQRFFGVILAVVAVRQARLLAVGERFPLMTDIELPEALARKHLGLTIRHVSTSAWTSCYREVPAAAVESGVRELKRRNAMSELTSDETRRSVQLSEALQALVEKHGAHGGTLNCHGAVCLRNKSIGITACYSLGVQNGLGRPFTCTGDLPTAIAMLLLKHLAGTSMYTEVQVMDERRGALVLANSGEGEDGIRRKSSRSCILGNRNFSGMHGRGASFAYPLQPGPATVVSFTPTPRGSRPFRLVFAEGEILKETLPDTGALAGFFRFRHADLHDGYTRWLEAGAVHHAATCSGHWGPELLAVAELLDLDFVNI